MERRVGVLGKTIERRIEKLLALQDSLSEMPTKDVEMRKTAAAVADYVEAEIKRLRQALHELA